MLQNDQSVWIDNPQDLEVMATNYFKYLFSCGEAFHPYDLSGHFPPIDDHLLTDLNKGITITEIWQTVKSIGAFKAPRPDGFQAIFFHTQRTSVGPAFCNMIQDIWNNPWKIKDLNATFISTMWLVRSS